MALLQTGIEMPVSTYCAVLCCISHDIVPERCDVERNHRINRTPAPWSRIEYGTCCAYLIYAASGMMGDEGSTSPGLLGCDAV